MPQTFYKMLFSGKSIFSVPRYPGKPEKRHLQNLAKVEKSLYNQRAYLINSPQGIYADPKGHADPEGTLL